LKFAAVLEGVCSQAIIACTRTSVYVRILYRCLPGSDIIVLRLEEDVLLSTLGFQKKDSEFSYPQYIQDSEFSYPQYIQDSEFSYPQYIQDSEFSYPQ